MSWKGSFRGLGWVRVVRCCQVVMCWVIPWRCWVLCMCTGMFTSERCLARPWEPTTVHGKVPRMGYGPAARSHGSLRSPP